MNALNQCSFICNAFNFILEIVYLFRAGNFCTVDIEINVWSQSDKFIIRYPVASIKQPIRSQGILRSTNERSKKLQISKIERSNRFCVIFRSAHRGNQDKRWDYPTQNLGKVAILKVAIFFRNVVRRKDIFWIHNIISENVNSNKLALNKNISQKAICVMIVRKNEKNNAWYWIKKRLVWEEIIIIVEFS